MTRKERHFMLIMHVGKQNGMCAYCATSISAAPMSQGTTMATLEHIIPKSRGGVDSVENTCAACWQCNRLKAHLTPVQMRNMADKIDAFTQSALDKEGGK